MCEVDSVLFVVPFEGFEDCRSGEPCFGLCDIFATAAGDLIHGLDATSRASSGLAVPLAIRF